MLVGAKIDFLCIDIPLIINKKGEPELAFFSPQRKISAMLILEVV